MSSLKFLYLILFIGILSCDTAKTIEPIGDAYFLKFYGQVGNQEGVSVQSTSDGGFIIGGNSIGAISGSSDYMLIKVDKQGNQEWLKTYDFGGDDRFTEVLSYNNQYLIAGTSTLSANDGNDYTKIVLKKVSEDGTEIDDFIVAQDTLIYNNYVCTDISIASSGKFLVTGTYDGKAGASVTGNSVLAVVENDFSSDQNYFSGLDNPEVVFVKVQEVMNQFTNEVNYLVFAHKAVGTELFISLYQYQTNLTIPNSAAQLNFLNSKIKDVVSLPNNKYMILASSGGVTSLVQVVENSYGYFYPSAGQVIKSELNLNGTSISISENGNYAISADITEANSTNTLSTIFESNLFGTINWQRIFGTPLAYPYKAGKVEVLLDGSVVFTGTAGLESQTKAFLIKMKSNGDMK